MNELKNNVWAASAAFLCEKVVVVITTDSDAIVGVTDGQFAVVRLGQYQQNIEASLRRV